MMLLKNVAVFESTCGIYFSISPNDEEFVSRYRWHVEKSEFIKSNGRRTMYVRALVDGKMQSLHTMLANPSKGLFVDHIDGNGLNNTRENLQIVSNSLNIAKARRHFTNTSGYRGVYLCRGLWRSRITKDGARVELGSYESKEDAARAYNRASKELFDEFGYQNQITEQVG